MASAFGKDGVDSVRAGGNWFAVRRYGDLERHQRARAEVGLGGGEDVRKLAEDISEAVDHRWGPSGTVEVEDDVAQMRRQTVPEMEEASSVVGVEGCKELWARGCRWDVGIGWWGVLAGHRDVVV